MPYSVVEQYNLDKKKFDATGAFDAMVDWDSRYFVDPRLLVKATTPEFQGAHQDLIKHFVDTLKLILRSKVPNDLCWKEAQKRLEFKEPGAFGLGYATGSVRGSGIGDKYSTTLVKNLKEIVDVGVQDPELFELLSLFEDGIGADRISDMVCNILIARFAKFTERVFVESNYSGSGNVDFMGCKIPRHPGTDSPLLLTPKEILTNLPVAEEEGGNLSQIIEQNESLRKSVNNMFGTDWKKAVSEMTKADRYKLFKDDPEILKALIKVYREKTGNEYDFQKDPNGEFVWREATKSVVQKHPLQLALADPGKLDDVNEVTKKICEQFQENIEKHGGWEVLWNDKKNKRRAERIAQKSFAMTAHSYCKANNIDLSPESNAGQGPVDFKCSRGQEKTVVEVKFDDNTSLVSGFEKQTKIYQESEGAQRAIYLVLLTKDNSKASDKLTKSKNKMAADGYVPELIYVDATVKKSASKVK